VIGKSVTQQGSLVGPEYLRFDFTCPSAPSEEQLSKVENLVRDKIAQDHPVTCEVMPRTKAQKLGAMALFGEKYGSQVRVVAIGTQNKNELGQAFSKEFCGGTHVERIGAIGGFKIVKQESISAGVRRITALTGPGLARYLDRQNEIVNQLSKMLKVPADNLPERIEQLIKQNKKLSRELKSASKQSPDAVIDQAKQLLEKSDKIGPSSVIIGQLSKSTIEQARSAIDMLKKKAKSAAIVLGFEQNEKAVLLAGVTEDLVKQGLNAGDIINLIAPVIDGGGGGKPHMAQAGGREPQKLNDALAKAEQIIKEKLS